MTRTTHYRCWGKRTIDIVVSLVALLLLAPVLLVLAVLVRVFLGGPILFRQTRSGLKQKPFTILKFRTMTDARDAAGNPLSDTERLTRFGKFLRATSLDELPELLNVLKGDMSLVGPRPLLPRYDVWYRPEELARFDVLPGITGWAQVNGRNSSSWDERFRHDVWYVEACSFWLDLKVLYLTVGKVLLRKDVHVNTELSMLSLDDERRAGSIPPTTAAHENPVMS